MDPYRLLGVSRGCTPEEVKAAFRAMVPLVHPDRGGEELTFIQLHAAYEQVLAEADAYQRFGVHRALKGSHDEVVATRPDPATARKMYRDWLYKVAHRSSRRRRKWVGRVGATFLLYLVFSIPATGLCQAVMLSLEMESKVRRFGWNTVTFDGCVLVAIHVTSLLFACLLMWKYKRH